MPRVELCLVGEPQGRRHVEGDRCLRRPLGGQAEALGHLCLSFHPGRALVVRGVDHVVQAALVHAVQVQGVDDAGDLGRTPPRWPRRRQRPPAPRDAPRSSSRRCHGRLSPSRSRSWSSTGPPGWPPGGSPTAPGPAAAGLLSIRRRLRRQRPRPLPSSECDPVLRSGPTGIVACQGDAWRSSVMAVRSVCAPCGPSGWARRPACRVVLCPPTRKCRRRPPAGDEAPPTPTGAGWRPTGMERVRGVGPGSWDTSRWAAAPKGRRASGSLELPKSPVGGGMTAEPLGGIVVAVAYVLGGVALLLTAILPRLLRRSLDPGDGLRRCRVPVRVPAGRAGRSIPRTTWRSSST